MASAKVQRYELFIQRFTSSEQDLRRFIRSLVPTWTDTDEVLQQTTMVIWRKFEHYDPDTKFMKWACVIARFEVLAYRRKMARDRLVFREDVLDLMADEGQEEIDQGRAGHDALVECLSEMPDQQKQFVLLAYTPGVKVKELAEEAGSSPAAYYMRLKRVRGQLMDCVEGKTRKKEAFS